MPVIERQRKWTAAAEAINVVPRRADGALWGRSLYSDPAYGNLQLQ